MQKLFLKVSILFAVTSVLFGAFGAHALKEIIDEKHLLTFETGVRYQFYHAFGLMLASMLYKEYNNKFTLWACRFFVIGVFLFSGSLYALSVLNESYHFIGAITPFGGLSFIIGWLLLLKSVSK